MTKKNSNKEIKTIDIDKISDKIYSMFAKEELGYAEALAVLENVKMWIISDYTMDFIGRQKESNVDEIHVKEK